MMEMETTDRYYLISKQRYFDNAEDSRLFKKLLELKPHQSYVYTCDELGTANLIADLYSDSIRYCPQYGDWYIWDGIRFTKQIDSSVISDTVQTVLNLLLYYAGELKVIHPDVTNEQYEKFVKSLRKNSVIKNLIELLKTQSRISPMDFDNNPYLLNTPAYAIDLKSMLPIENRKDRYITQVTTVSPITSFQKKCTRWYTFIDEIMCGNQEQASFLQRALGYSMLGINREECMFIALGSETRNGKGTLFSSIMNVLGKEYAQGSDPSLICESKSGRGIDFNAPQPALRKLVDCRFVVMSEAQRDVRLDSASMKAMTGRDTLTTRGLYEGSFDFVPQFTMWLNTNYLPCITDDTVFKSDRIWVIKFNAHFDEQHRDLDLKQIFAENDAKATILDWLLQGCKDYLENGLQVPECVREYTEEYRNKYDRIGNFLTEVVEFNQAEKTLRSDLYEAYRTWCYKAENHYQPLGSNNFYTELALRKIIASKTCGEYYYSGLKINTGKKCGIIKLSEV